MYIFYQMTSLFCVPAYWTHILPGWEAGMGDSSGVLIYASITFHLKDIFIQVLFVYCKIPKVGIFLTNIHTSDSDYLIILIYRPAT